MSRYTAVTGLPICVLHGEEVLHQFMPWQELFVMIAAGAVDLGASFGRGATGQELPFMTAVNPKTTTASASKARERFSTQFAVRIDHSTI